MNLYSVLHAFLVKKRDEGKVLDESISNSAQNQRSSLLSVGARARSVRISKARSGDSYFMPFLSLATTLIRHLDSLNEWPMQRTNGRNCLLFLSRLLSNFVRYNIPSRECFQPLHSTTLCYDNNSSFHIGILTFSWSLSFGSRGKQSAPSVTILMVRLLHNV